MTAVEYTGHGANTGGLQSHSVGDIYPYTIVGVAGGNLGPKTRWRILDTRTGECSYAFTTYGAAETLARGILSGVEPRSRWINEVLQ